MRHRTFLGLTLVLTLVAGLHSSASPTPPPGFLADIDWPVEDPEFGGISGIAVKPDGIHFIALSDHGAVVRGRLLRDAAGLLIGVDSGPLVPLSKPDGTPLGRGQTDSEGLALAPDGGFFVSFEGIARVRRYATPEAPAEKLPGLAAFEAMGHNASLEALCLGPDGALYTIPEETAPNAPFPVYRLRGGWDRYGSIPRDEEFLTVDCAVGPDGRFYLLQRAFHGLAGFASRLDRFDFGAQGLTGQIRLFQSETGTFDNLEGLSVWRDAQGTLRATMVSDDNYSVFFVTELVEFALPD
jgi:hypothetical protein